MFSKLQLIAFHCLVVIARFNLTIDWLIELNWKLPWTDKIFGRKTSSDSKFRLWNSNLSSTKEFN